MEHQEWYKKWFNTKYYHLLYHYRNEQEAEYFISNIIKHLQLPKNSVIWDNACGKGRHSYFLSKLGYKVIGTDISENNIRVANENYKNSNLSFFIHDMRREFYANYFDVVLNLFTSIGYFNYEYEEKKSIKVMAHALKNNGYIIIDFFNPYPLMQNTNKNTLEKKEVKGILFEIEKIIDESKRVIKKIKVIDKQKEYYFEEIVRLLPKEFFIQTLEENKIKVQKIWGEYDLSEYQPNVSKRMIFLGKKL